MLYAASSVGALRPGTLRRGSETSEDEHMRELAARLLSEAEEAAEVAADARNMTARERREGAADRRVLLRIADKAQAFLQPAPKVDRTRIAFDDKLAEISALREGVAEPFVPLFDHLIALARQSQSAGRAQRAKTELAKARKIAAEHPRRASGGNPRRAGGGEAPKKSAARLDAEISQWIAGGSSRQRDVLTLRKGGDWIRFSHVLGEDAATMQNSVGESGRMSLPESRERMQRLLAAGWKLDPVGT